MAAAGESRLSRPDIRPILISVLGSGWVLMGCFGVLRALILVAGISQGVQIGAEDPRAEIAAYNPEFVNEAYREAAAKRESAKELERNLGLPLLVLSGLAIYGGVRLLQRRRHARTVLLLTGLGVIALSVMHAKGMMEIGLRADPALEIPEDFVRSMWIVAGLNVALQSVLLVVGMGLLRHPIVRQWANHSPHRTR